MRTKFSDRVFEERSKPDIVSIWMPSWRHFFDVMANLLDETDYIWRGQACDNWQLEPSLDRILKQYPEPERAKIAEEHLKRFQFALRGRRGTNPVKLEKHELNEWWALGQHQGLKTPLLDWTKSPWVALYFAFITIEKSQTEYRVVYALQRKKIESVSNVLNEDDKIRFVSPFIGDNPRLINQNGLFTKTPLCVSIEEWISKNIKQGIPIESHPLEEERGETVQANLYKIYVPDNGRDECLRCLNRMNINHLTLFPDPFGASEYCNQCLHIRNYDAGEEQ